MAELHTSTIRLPSCRDMPLRALIADDEQLYCQLLSQQVRALLPDTSILTVTTLEELRAIETEKITFALVGLALADGSALSWVKRWSESNRTRKVIALTRGEEDYHVHGVFTSPIAGCVDKNDGLEFLEMAIRAVLAGGSFFSPRVQAMRARLSADPNHFSKLLSPREQTVLQLIGEGLSAAQIAQRLGLKTTTVHDHRKNLMHKLNLHSQTQLLTYALRKGFSRLGNVPPRR